MIKDEPAIPLWRHPVLVAAVAGTLLLFSLGLIAGVVASSIEREAMKPLGAAFLVGALVVVVASTWLLKRSIPAIFTQVSPRVGRARKMLVWSMVIGALLGMFLVLGSLAVGTEPPEVFSKRTDPAMACHRCYRDHPRRGATDHLGLASLDRRARVRSVPRRYPCRDLCIFRRGTGLVAGLARRNAARTRRHDRFPDRLRRLGLGLDHPPIWMTPPIPFPFIHFVFV